MRTWPVLALLLTAATDTAAQSAFVSGAYARDVKRFSGESENVLNGTSDSASLGIGGFLTPRWTVGVEIDLDATSAVTRTETVRVTGRPTEVHTRYTNRLRSVSALLGYHPAERQRVRLGCYVGLTFSEMRRTIASDAPPIVLQSPSSESVFVDVFTGPIVGIDAAVHVTRHLAVVPSLRAQGLSLAADVDGVSIKPSIGARWVF